MSLFVKNYIKDSFSNYQHLFNGYSSNSQERVVNEIFERSQKMNIEETRSLIQSVIFTKPGKPVAPAMCHPMGDLFVSFLLTDSNWYKKLPPLKQALPFLPSILWKTDPELSTATKNWLQAKISSAPQEVLDGKMRAIYLRNLVSYYPYFHPEKGEKIELPLGEKGGNITYRVDPIALTPAYLGSPLMAYGFIPEEEGASPLIVFKGTTYPADDGFWLSIFTDINPWGPIGSLGFWFGKSKIENWLAKHTQKGVKAEIMGASLGGSLSLQTASKYPQFVKAVHAFNSPAVTSDEVNAWNKYTGVKPEVNVYLQDGDPVSSSVGRVFASDWNIYHVFAPDVSAAQTHASAYTAHPESFIIPDKADNVNADMKRRIWPALQHIVLFPLFLIGGLCFAPFVLMRLIASGFKFKVTPEPFNTP